MRAPWDETTREENLMRKLNAQLNFYHNRQEPLRAAEIVTTVSTEELAEVMAWAVIALRGVVVQQKFAMRETTVKSDPYLMANPPKPQPEKGEEG